MFFGWCATGGLAEREEPASRPLQNSKGRAAGPLVATPSFAPGVASGSILKG
jgi:hypothetical protein